MASHNMHFNRFSGIYLSVIQQKIHQLRLMGSVLDCLPHLPWTKSSSPIDIPKERRRQDLRLGSERHYEFDPTGAKSCRFPWLKKNGAVLGGELVLRKIKNVSGLHMFTCWFSPVFFRIWFWGFFWFLEMFSAFRCGKEWRNLGKKTTMRPWPSSWKKPMKQSGRIAKKPKRMAFVESPRGYLKVLESNARIWMEMIWQYYTNLYHIS